MTEPLFIGIDIGTQGTKTVLCSADGRIISEAFSPSVLEQPEPGAVTENPERIFNSVISTVKEAISAAGVDGSRVAAVGIDSQMAGVIGVGSDFSAVTPLDSWLDSRCSDYTQLIKREAETECVTKSGGQVINSHAPKILWWKHERPEAFSEIKKFVMPNGYVTAKLCGISTDNAFIDPTFLHFNNFSDNKNLTYNHAVLAAFGISEDLMPEIVSPEKIIGGILPEYAAACGLSPGTKIIAGCGDTAASSLGAGIVREGLAYDVAGTASVFACCSKNFSPDNKHGTLMLSRSVIDGLFLPLSYVTGGGMTLKWFSEVTKTDLKTLDKEAKEASPGSGGVVFIPHFSGRSFPFDSNADGAFMGLRINTGRAELFRAVLEAIAFEYRGYLEIMCETGCVKKLTSIRGVGGGAKSRVFAKIKADILGADYLIAEHICSAPQTMARLAAHATGFLKEPLSELFGSRGHDEQCISYNSEAHKAYAPHFERYTQLTEKYLA